MFLMERQLGAPAVVMGRRTTSRCCSTGQTYRVDGNALPSPGCYRCGRAVNLGVSVKL
jgi:hypothetical protein